MTLALVVCGVVALLLPGLRPTTALYGHPRWFSTLAASALVLGLAAIVAGLVTAVGVGVVHLVAGTALMTYGAHLAPGGMIASSVAALVLAWIMARLALLGWRVRRGRRRARADGWLGSHHRSDEGHDLVVLPTRHPVAYSVDGSPPQIVISDGMRWQASELVDFIIDHERAHLRRGHRRHLFIAAAAESTFGPVPLVRRSAMVLRLAVERSADEDAAGRDGRRRRLVGTTLGRLNANLIAVCTPEAVRYRAMHLSLPAPAAGRVELGATVGLVALGAITLTIVMHIGTDVPALLGTLRS